MLFYEREAALIDVSLAKTPPIDGQDTLDNSFSIGGNTARRVSISNGEFVVLDQTSEGIYHGHVRTWEEIAGKTIDEY